jgi:hypothetical protein
MYSLFSGNDRITNETKLVNVPKEELKTPKEEQEPDKDLKKGLKTPKEELRPSKEQIKKELKIRFKFSLFKK